MSLSTFTYCPLCKNLLKPDGQGYHACVNDDCDFIHYDNPVPVAAAVVQYQGEQVVLGHNRAWPPEWFGLITGFVEKYETPEETIIREVKEELGLDGTIGGFIGHYMFKRMNQLIIAYHVEAEGTILLEDEIDDCRMIPFSKARYWPAGTGYALRDFLESRGFSPQMIDFKKGQ